MPSMTITTTAGQAQRMQDAVQRATGASQSPSAETVRQFWIHQMRVFVQDQEKAAAVAATQATPPTAFDPT